MFPILGALVVLVHFEIAKFWGRAKRRFLKFARKMQLSGYGQNDDFWNLPVKITCFLYQGWPTFFAA